MNVKKSKSRDLGTSLSGSTSPRRGSNPSLTEHDNVLNAACRRTWPAIAPLQAHSFYTNLLQLITSNYEFTALFANLIDASETQMFAKTFTTLFGNCGGTLHLLEVLINGEFQHVTTAFERTAVLRGNGVLSKVESVYLARVAISYVSDLLSELVCQVIDDPSLELEIDPIKLRMRRPELFLESDEGPVLEQNARMLHRTASLFLARITHPEALQKMPRDVRVLAWYIQETAHRHGLPADEALALVGGFVMLRFFCPAIVAPELWIPSCATITSHTRRNLVLIAKILQNAANGMSFGKKEQCMLVMNPYMPETIAIMHNYLKQVTVDPLVSEESPKPWSDLLEADKKPINLSEVDLRDVVELHRFLHQASPHLVSALAIAAEHKARQPTGGADSKPRSTTSPDCCVYGLCRLPQERLLKLMELLVSMGPPPLAPTDPIEDGALERTTTSAEAPGSRTTVPESTDVSAGGENVLADAGFLYRGRPAKDGAAVFYIIVNRIKLEHVANINPLVSFIFAVMDDAVSQPYNLVIDMSWAHISAPMKSLMYHHLAHMASSFSRKYKKNLNNLFIVHPNAYTRAVVTFMRAFTSRKLVRKLREIYNWKDLEQLISFQNIDIPQSSKDYITRAHSVMKVNAKGKSQKRLIKFTGNSILNIDPKTRTLKNEKLLSEIQEISAFSNSNEIHFTFVDQPSTPVSLSARKLGRSSAWLNRMTSSTEDRFFRRYVCVSAKDRDDILLDTWRTCIAMCEREASSTVDEFPVIKVNLSGKRQSRVFKFTCDSLLNLDNGRIKREISFAGILSATLGGAHSEHPTLNSTLNSSRDVKMPTVLLHFKGEEEPRLIFCERAEDLVKTINSYVARYRSDDASEYSHERDDAVPDLPAGSSAE